MRTYLRWLRVALAVVVLSGAAAWAQGEHDDFGATLGAFTAGADRIQAAIERDDLTAAGLQEALGQLEDGRRLWLERTAAAEAQLQPLQVQLEALGTPPEGTEEPAPIAQERARLSAEVAAVETRLRQAQQAVARAGALIDALSQLRLERFQTELMTRGPTPLSVERIAGVWSAVERQMRAIRVEVQTRLAVGGAMQSMVDRLILPVVISILALAFGIVFRRWLVARLQAAVTEDASRARRLGIAVGITFARLLMPAAAVMLILAGFIYSDLIGPTGKLFAEAAVGGALAVIAAFALGGAFFAPNTDGIRLSSLPGPAAGRANAWLIAVAAVVALDNVLIGAGEEAGLGINALSVLNAGVLILGGVALWRFGQAARLGKAAEASAAEIPADDPDDLPPPPQASPLVVLLRAARIGVRLVAVAAPLLALAGYYGASRFIFYPVVFSGALIGLCVLVYHVMREASLLARADDAADEDQGISAIPVFTGFVLAMLSAPLLAIIWGATETDLVTAWTRIVEGFQIGETVISPIDFLLFAIVFAIGYGLTRIFQGVLRRSVLPLTKLDDGAKSALVAGIGYVGVVVTALVAISTTGLDLSNLAIVAGALSVGIGFGLQNIVNNFVSGVILLIERPIKIGDWVEIGGVHGTVQKVNVRSTEIQTFDRSTMFVPNADLISGTVTNWTHSNNHGRIIVRVSVAYGSDVRQVEKILSEVAQGHTMLMRRPAPYVIFTGFGSDGLDFEIRGVLRDVNWILNVSSDLRFAIYERFAEAEIEIPFAQRDLHIRNAAELGAAIRGEAPAPAPVAGSTGPSLDKLASVPREEGPDGGEADTDGDAR